RTRHRGARGRANLRAVRARHGGVSIERKGDRLGTGDREGVRGGARRLREGDELRERRAFSRSVRARRAGAAGSARADAEARGSRGMSDKGRLLLVDDDESLLKILEIRLQREGYSVMTADGG